MVLQGYGPDGFAQGFDKEGGRSACAAKYASWRRKQKGVYENQTDQAIQQKKDATNKSAEADDSSTTGVTSAVVKFPVRFAQGLGRKITVKSANRRLIAIIFGYVLIITVTELQLSEWRRTGRIARQKPQNWQKKPKQTGRPLAVYCVEKPNFAGGENFLQKRDRPSWHRSIGGWAKSMSLVVLRQGAVLQCIASLANRHSPPQQEAKPSANPSSPEDPRA